MADQRDLSPQISYIQASLGSVGISLGAKDDVVDSEFHAGITEVFKQLQTLTGNTSIGNPSSKEARDALREQITGFRNSQLYEDLRNMQAGRFGGAQNDVDLGRGNNLAADGIYLKNNIRYGAEAGPAVTIRELITEYGSEEQKADFEKLSPSIQNNVPAALDLVDSADGLFDALDAIYTQPESEPIQVASAPEKPPEPSSQIEAAADIPHEPIQSSLEFASLSDDQFVLHVEEFIQRIHETIPESKGYIPAPEKVDGMFDEGSLTSLYALNEGVASILNYLTVEKGMALEGSPQDISTILSHYKDLPEDIQPISPEDLEKLFNINIEFGRRGSLSASPIQGDPELTSITDDEFQTRVEKFIQKMHPITAEMAAEMNPDIEETLPAPDIDGRIGEIEIVSLAILSGIPAAFAQHLIEDKGVALQGNPEEDLGVILNHYRELPVDQQPLPAEDMEELLNISLELGRRAEQGMLEPVEPIQTPSQSATNVTLASAAATESSTPMSISVEDASRFVETSLSQIVPQIQEIAGGQMSFVELALNNPGDADEIFNSNQSLQSLLVFLRSENVLNIPGNETWRYTPEVGQEILNNWSKIEELVPPEKRDEFKKYYDEDMRITLIQSLDTLYENGKLSQDQLVSNSPFQISEQFKPYVDTALGFLRPFLEIPIIGLLFRMFFDGPIRGFLGMGIDDLLEQGTGRSEPPRPAEDTDETFDPRLMTKAEPGPTDAPTTEEKVVASADIKTSVDAGGDFKPAATGIEQTAAEPDPEQVAAAVDFGIAAANSGGAITYAQLTDPNAPSKPEDETENHLEEMAANKDSATAPLEPLEVAAAPTSSPDPGHNA